MVPFSFLIEAEYKKMMMQQKSGMDFLTKNLNTK